MGAINDKLDYDLLAAVAAARPGLDAGPGGAGRCAHRRGSGRGWRRLRRLPNVHLLGQVAVADVPRYMAACRVCLLPYKLNERTRNISSLKLYEYLACGKPVVSTDVPAAHEVSDDLGSDLGSDLGGMRLAIAGNERFVAAIEQALAGAGDEARRLAVAQANTWDSRVEAISAIIQEALLRKQAASF